MRVRRGALGISSVFLPCAAVWDYFYHPGNLGNSFGPETLYKTIRVENRASPAEIRIAFKLQGLELDSIGATRAEHIKLDRAFNILGHPELRAHYDSLVANPEIPARFPYGGAGSLLVAGDRSSSGEAFFARRILAFVPCQMRRKFLAPLRYCDFYPDKAFFRDARRKLQFWLDPALTRISWDPSWNRWKHLLSSKIEVEGSFVRSVTREERDAQCQFVEWETGLPSRISLKLPNDFDKEIENARNAYSKFGQYSAALNRIRRCLEHKVMERRDLERVCAELGMPGDFDVGQISWRPDYDPFLGSEQESVSRPA